MVEHLVWWHFLRIDCKPVESTSLATQLEFHDGCDHHYVRGHDHDVHARGGISLCSLGDEQLDIPNHRLCKMSQRVFRKRRRIHNNRTLYHQDHVPRDETDHRAILHIHNCTRL